jgi:hypothetical protein
MRFVDLAGAVLGASAVGSCNLLVDPGQHYLSPDGGLDAPTGGSAAVDAGAGGAMVETGAGGASGGASGQPDGGDMSCADVTDDDLCKGLLGSGYLCIDGRCARGDCRVNAQCPGKCVDNLCVPFTGDPDCPAPSVCNTESGSCVAKSQCAGHGAGDVCPVNASDLCCQDGADLSCVAASCCTAANCKAGESCISGACVPVGCPPPTGTDLYVDPAVPTEGSGSAGCPFRTLTKALTVVAMAESASDPSVSFTVHLKGTISAATEGSTAFPVPLSSNVTVMGDGGKQEVLAPDQKDAFLVNTAATVHLDSLVIAQDGVGTAGIGIDAENRNGQLFLTGLLIQHFASGIRVNNYGAVSIGADVISSQNHDHGIRIDTAAVDIRVSDGQLPTRFDSNTYGIYIEGGNSLVHVAGADAPAGDGGVPGKLISADNNAQYGVRYFTRAVDVDGDPSTLDNLEMNGNSIGLYLFATCKLAMTNCDVRNNVTGIRVVTSDGADALGLDPNDVSPASITHCRIANNTNDICLALTADSPAPMNAQFNTFTGHDCTQPDTGETLSRINNCGVNYNLGFIHGVSLNSSIDVTYCQ